MRYLLSLILISLCLHISFAQEDGEYKDYYNSGELRVVGQYKNKKRVGEWTSYHKNGKVSSVYSYNDGKPNIEFTSFYDDGSVRTKREKKGDIYLERSYYESGNLFYERAYKDGYYKEFREDGSLKVEANYREFQLYGKWKEYHENGEVKWSVSYENGYRNGIYEQYFNNGQLKVNGVILKEKKNGEEKRYSKEGYLIWKGYYDNDEFVRTWIKYDEKGKKVDKINTKREDLPLQATKVPDGAIEKVPIFPGCDEVFGNDNRKKCLNQNIAQFIVTNFNTDIAANKGLSGRQKILVAFKVDKMGYISVVNIKAPHPTLRIETKRIMEMMPRLEPGYVRGKPVTVPFSLPIVFQVQ